MHNSLKLHALLATSMLLVIVSWMNPVQAEATGDDGGYPWADALAVNVPKYDWGYLQCQPKMQLARLCPGHVVSKGGLKYYLSDPWHYDVRNCTSYVAWRVNREQGLNISGWGNATDWAQQAQRAGFQVNQTPQVGSIAQWDGKLGHVAYVTAVNPDLTVNVEQYNKAGTGEFSRQSRLRADHYIHVEPKITVQTTVVSVPQPIAATTTTTTTIAATAKANLPALQPNNLLIPASPDVQYLPEIDPISHTVIFYAIQRYHTASGKVEITKSNGADGNSTWEATEISSQLIDNDPSTNFTLGDYDADGKLDLYRISKTSDQNSNLSVTVISGSQDYQQRIGSWQTTVSATEATKADYSIADYDGDGNLDLYLASQDTTEHQSLLTVLSGSTHFANLIGQWHTANNIPEGQDAHFSVSDHDQDGKVDLCQVLRQPSEQWPSAVTVFSAASDYQQPQDSWRPEEVEH